MQFLNSYKSKITYLQIYEENKTKTNTNKRKQLNATSQQTDKTIQL